MVRRAGLAAAGGLHVLLPWSRGDNSTVVLLLELHLPRLLIYKGGVTVATRIVATRIVVVELGMARVWDIAIVFELVKDP